LVSELGEGASAGTVSEASAAGIVVLAVPWPRVFVIDTVLFALR
jgi:predicted dinucleotide-binding enzyme